MNNKKVVWSEFIADKNEELNDDIAEYIKGISELCENGNFKIAFETIKICCDNQVKLCFELMTKATKVWFCDNAIYEYYNILMEICQGIFPLKHYLERDELSKVMKEFMLKSSELSCDSLFVFIQTLEKLYALGYKGIAHTIFRGYQKLSCINQEIKIRKNMAYVYCLNMDNFNQIREWCFNVYREVRKCIGKPLKIQCWYYLGLIQEFERRNGLIEYNNICNIGAGAKNFMDRSYEKGSLLANMYVTSNELRNFVGLE